MRRILPLLTLTLALFLSGCSSKKTVWIYTSLYNEVIAEMDPLLRQAVPDAEVKWFQGGSENVAAKLNAELAAGKTKADLILTSDPFWYEDLKRNGKLLAYPSEAAKAVPANLRDPDGAYATVRIPVMALAYNSEAYKSGELPESWKDLAGGKWKGKVSMGSPLESGTMFTTVALLAKAYGWDFFRELRKQELVAAGGNSTVINRIETKERPVGVVLLENILNAQAKGSPVRAIYPSDGVIPVPSPIAILKESAHPELARKIYDWFFSAQAQAAIVRGGMYSPLESVGSPGGARPWQELKQKMLAWSPEVVREIFGARDQIKARFSEAVLH